MAAQPWMKLWVRDILADPRYRLLRSEGRAVYFHTLMELHMNEGYEVSGHIEDLCILYALRPSELSSGIDQVERLGIFDVTRSHESVTIVSREIKAECDDREKARLRKRKQRNGGDLPVEDPIIKSPCPPPVTNTHAGACAASASSSASADAELVLTGKELVMTKAEDARENFDDFWEAYDRKVGKAAAKKAWAHLTLWEKGVIMSHVAHFVESTPDARFRPHASTYLNGKRFLDDELPDGRRLEREDEEPSAGGVSREPRAGRVLGVHPSPRTDTGRPGAGGSDLSRPRRRSAREISEQSFAEFIGAGARGEGGGWRPPDYTRVEGADRRSDQDGRLQLEPTAARRPGEPDGDGGA